MGVAGTALSGLLSRLATTARCRGRHGTTTRDIASPQLAEVGDLTHTTCNIVKAYSKNRSSQVIVRDGVYYADEWFATENGNRVRAYYACMAGG